MMAAISRAKIIAKPLPAPISTTRSTGNRAMTLKATAPLENSTPRKLQKPDQSTAALGGNEWV